MLGLVGSPPAGYLTLATLFLEELRQACLLHRLADADFTGSQGLGRRGAAWLRIGGKVGGDGLAQLRGELALRGKHSAVQRWKLLEFHIGHAVLRTIEAVGRAVVLAHVEVARVWPPRPIR